MSYQIEYLPSALRDLTEIAYYIGVKLQNQTAADSLSEKIVSMVEQFSDMPYRYPAYHPVRPLKMEYRKLVVDNYVVFYHIEEEKRIVSVARVIYGGRRIDEILG